MNYQTHFALLATIALAVGCGPKSETASTDAGSGPIVMDGMPPATVDVHAHPSEGPHHGSLIELGNEEYHVELVHDDKSVTVYILDAAAKVAVAIDAADVTINLLHDGKPEQFKLIASTDSGDPKGKSSRFTLADAELAGHIDDETAKPKLMLTIDGTPYRGEIKHDHDHDHEGHNH